MKLNNDFYRDIDIEMENIDAGLLEIERHEVRPESVDEDAVPQILKKDMRGYLLFSLNKAVRKKKKKVLIAKGKKK